MVGAARGKGAVYQAGAVMTAFILFEISYSKYNGFRLNVLHFEDDFDGAALFSVNCSRSFLHISFMFANGLRLGVRLRNEADAKVLL